MDSLLTSGLKSLPSDARPREKLLARGPGALSDAELLALLLRTGIPGKHVVQLAQELLDRFGGVGGLLHTGAEALKVIKGLGPAKRAEVVAVLAVVAGVGQRNHRRAIDIQIDLHITPKPLIHRFNRYDITKSVKYSYTNTLI